MPGKLSIVATPIGNMEDITLRALRVLSECDVIFAEDTRHTAHLLTRHQIRKPLQSCHAFSEASRCEDIISRIEQGQHVSLVSDAGSPAISDPGFRVVRACLEKQLPLEVIPGPCAAIAGLTVSGLPTHEFHFLGFLPSKAGAAEKRLRELIPIPGTFVLYESPYRVIRTLRLIAQIFPERQVVVARELTKKFEEVLRGSASELEKHFEAHSPKGEFVLLISPAEN
jgi:16S rRNA (cytidine1402-2'-O)-methyltransferase